VIIANLQEHDVVLVGSVENSYDQVVFARPGTATRFEQLKGKRFGIQRLWIGDAQCGSDPV